MGTPAQIVDEMAARFGAGGADGFGIMPATPAGGLDDVIELALHRIIDLYVSAKLIPKARAPRAEAILQPGFSEALAAVR